MTQDYVVEIRGADAAEHRAALAWERVAPGFGKPDKITVLKHRGHSTVFRLHGAGPEGAAVIAKNCEPANAAVERAIYEDILVRLPLTVLRFYGSVMDDGHTTRAQRCWLFLEDAGDEKYSSLSEEHRALAGRWLGVLHSSAACASAAAFLPKRGPVYYLGRLQYLRDAIHRSLINPAVDSDGLWIFNAILKQSDVLESHWSEIECSCNRMPDTLVHGDLAIKNARIRTSEAGNNLVVLDWETAGWGTPAVDLAQFAARALSPDIAAYLSVAPPRWPDAADMMRIVELGNIFRLIVATVWEMPRLLGAWVKRALRNMALYQAEMADCIRASGWED